MLMLFVLSSKTGNVDKPGIWLAKPPSESWEQSQDSSPNLSKVLQVLHSQQAVTHSHSQSRQCPGRLEARPEDCSALSLSLNKTVYLISLTDIWQSLLY